MSLFHFQVCSEEGQEKDFVLELVYCSVSLNLAL